MKLRLSQTIIAIALWLPMLTYAQDVQNFKPYDQSGVGVFEAEKDATPYDGMAIRWGAAFTQQMQMLSHSTESDVPLYNLGYGFNTATANLLLDAQVADGVLVNLTTYLSSHHHPEAWVKGGYMQVDKLEFLGVEALDRIMDYVTIRAGHFGINYGDAHFRRTDNGNAMHNPFVGNYIMDAFATEIGGDILFRHNGMLALVGITGGEISGNIEKSGNRKPSFVGKLGYDTQVNPDLRLRLTGSAYHTAGSARSTLYAGDRTGSRYYLVLEQAGASAAADFRSGRIAPEFTDQVTAVMINPFVKFRGLELFGVAEFVSGRTHAESDSRSFTQLSGEAVYRFLPQEQLFVGARYNRVEGELVGSGNDITVDRIQLGAGWFMTPNILMKAEYVNQSYSGYPSSHIYNGGKFDGLMVEAVIAF